MLVLEYFILKLSILWFSLFGIRHSQSCVTSAWEQPQSDLSVTWYVTVSKTLVKCPESIFLYFFIWPIFSNHGELYFCWFFTESAVISFWNRHFKAKKCLVSVTKFKDLWCHWLYTLAFTWFISLYSSFWCDLLFFYLIIFVQPCQEYCTHYRCWEEPKNLELITKMNATLKKQF